MTINAATIKDAADLAATVAAVLRQLDRHVAAAEFERRAATVPWFNGLVQLAGEFGIEVRFSV